MAADLVALVSEAKKIILTKWQEITHSNGDSKAFPTHLVKLWDKVLHDSMIVVRPSCLRGITITNQKVIVVADVSFSYL